MILLFRFFLFIVLTTISVLAVLPDYSALPSAVSFNDLLNHAIAFIVLSFLYRVAYNHTLRRIIVTLVTYAIIIEAVQLFLPTRCASFEDILADSVGIIVGLVLVRIFRAFVPSGRTKN